MRARFPDLIYCSISAYGQEGPWSKKPGVDGVLQTVTGLMSISGSDDEAPSKVQAPLADMVTGYHTTMAVLAALNRRAAGSVPGHIDANLYASTLMPQQVPLVGYLTTKQLLCPHRGSASTTTDSPRFWLKLLESTRHPVGSCSA
jgi:crotonobetainyl-CoA:carnitine CoA-transferase CaiB-like acyl-CoA transferase